MQCKRGVVIVNRDERNLQTDVLECGLCVATSAPSHLLGSTRHAATALDALPEFSKMAVVGELSRAELGAVLVRPSTPCDFVSLLTTPTLILLSNMTTEHTIAPHNE